MGYGPLRHTFVYPGLLEKPNLERFFMQMYFCIEAAIEPSPENWLLGYNYVLTNMKSPEKPDITEVITKDLSVVGLYGDVVPPETLAKEVALELSWYAWEIERCIQQNKIEAALALIQSLLAGYPGEYDFFLDAADKLKLKGAWSGAKMALSMLIQRGNLPTPVMQRVKQILQEVVAARDTASGA